MGLTLDAHQHPTSMTITESTSNDLPARINSSTTGLSLAFGGETGLILSCSRATSAEHDFQCLDFIETSLLNEYTPQRVTLMSCNFSARCRQQQEDDPGSKQDNKV